MSEFVLLLLLFVVIGLLERFMKASSKAAKQSKAEAPSGGEWEPEERESTWSVPAELQDLIAEELGLGLERRPRVRRAPGGEVASLPGEAAASAGAGARGSAVAARRRQEVARRREESLRRMRETGDVPATRPWTSLERPRRPELHERSGDHYAVPAALDSPEKFRVRYGEAKARPARRRRRVLLPEGPHWSSAQKAIVWAEVLGPPKALVE